MMTRRRHALLLITAALALQACAHRASRIDGRRSPNVVQDWPNSALGLAPATMPKEKVIYTFWDSGYDNMPPMNKRNLQNWIEMTGGKYKIKVLTSKTDTDTSPRQIGDSGLIEEVHYKQLMPDVEDREVPTQEWIDSKLDTQKNMGFPQPFKSMLPTFIKKPYPGVPQSDFVRLAALKRFGGLWMDPSIILHRDLDDIAWNQLAADKGKELAGYVYAKYGNEKEADKYKGLDGGFENWFIAAKKDSEVLKEWQSKFIDYWEKKKPNQDIRDHPMFKDKKNLHLPWYVRNYLNQHASLGALIRERPELMERFITKGAGLKDNGPLTFIQIAGILSSKDQRKMIYDRQYADYFVHQIKQSDMSKFPSPTLKDIKPDFANPEDFDIKDSLFKRIYNRKDLGDVNGKRPRFETDIYLKERLRKTAIVSGSVGGAFAAGVLGIFIYRKYRKAREEGQLPNDLPDELQEVTPID